VIQRILVAYDTSEQALKAFQFAIEVAAKFNAVVTVLSVARLPEPAEIVETTGVLESAKEYYENHFRMLKEIAEAHQQTFLPIVKVGHPAEQILRTADEEKSDMIVMGHRGKSFVERWLLGSVSKRVLSYATCTVSIVR